MSIDDLKSLMDDFEPATLLPELENLSETLATLMRFAVMVGPVILLVMGILYLVAPPKEANHYFGYRCWFGMGSVDAWRFTQKLAGIAWSAIGLILTLVMWLRSGRFADLEVMDLLWSAGRCVIWEVVLVAGTCLAINILAAIRFDAKGELRRTKE